jgi:predicted transcriptional regulator
MNKPMPEFSYRSESAMTAANDQYVSRAKSVAPQSKQKATLDRTGTIVAAHVRNNPVGPDELPKLIRDVHATFAQLETGEAGSPTEQQPAVPIKKSITPDYLICLEDGKKFRTLKLHLKKAYGMTPQQYREKWGLSPNYPMVAPNYAKERSRIAKQIGLGQRQKET